MQPIHGCPDYCIWDFNGTILDDVEVGIRSVNHLLAERGLKQIGSREEYRQIFRFPVQEYYRYLGFDFETEPYEVIAPLWVEQYLKNVAEAVLFEDVQETICRLREKGIRQVVLSATEQNMLMNQLASLGITDAFEEVLGLDNIHAVSKLELARKWRKDHPDASAIYLGDTDHDCEAARSMNIPCVLITRGHQAPNRLKHLGVPMYDTLSDFVKTQFYLQ
ncbi:MAG: HAD hydrolase-like protein [Clostridia bacterium]|nr:HAD hydrolase-like protein [Clostridia bacterium]